MQKSHNVQAGNLRIPRQLPSGKKLLLMRFLEGSKFAALLVASAFLLSASAIVLLVIKDPATSSLMELNIWIYVYVLMFALPGLFLLINFTLFSAGKTHHLMQKGVLTYGTFEEARILRGKTAENTAYNVTYSFSDINGKERQLTTQLKKYNSTLQMPLLYDVKKQNSAKLLMDLPGQVRINTNGILTVQFDGGDRIYLFIVMFLLAAVLSLTSISTYFYINGGNFTAGECVEVRWSGKWWKATVLQSEGNRWLIQYDGWTGDLEWTDWVNRGSIRHCSSRKE